MIRSHAAGAGPEVEREVVRALMLLRLSHAGHRPHRGPAETAQALAALLSAGITPVVHEYGSLGCSGDLAPLAHCALALIGEGEVSDADGDAADRAGGRPGGGRASRPVELAEKEGLALINGTDGMLGMLVLALHDLRTLLQDGRHRRGDVVEGLLATDRVFAADLQALRPHPGQADSAAANLRALLAGSAIMASHRGPDCHRVQDAYSLRCSPQVHGAARDTVDARGTVAERELASADRQPGRARPTAGSRATATSTARRSPTCSTSWRSPSRTWPAWPSGVPTGSSTAPATTACRRSWPTTPASTAAT